MFRRRRKRSWGERIVELVWPRMGWRRASTYYALRLKRLPGTPYSIACGFACGASVSVTPFIGFHFLLAALITWILRGNLIAAAIGTAIGNPWTFPFIWLWLYHFGNWILGEDGADLAGEVTMGDIFHQPETVLLPMALAGVPTSLVVWFLFFMSIRRIIANYQQHRLQRRMRRRSALAAPGNQPAPIKNDPMPSFQPGHGPDDVGRTHAERIDIPEPHEASDMGTSTKGKG